MSYAYIIHKHAQHLKKDGTPDKRFKENKTSTRAYTATPVPRYESNEYSYT